MQESSRHGNARNPSTGGGPRFVSAESLCPFARCPAGAEQRTASPRARCGPRASALVLTCISGGRLRASRCDRRWESQVGQHFHPQDVVGSEEGGPSQSGCWCARCAPAGGGGTAVCLRPRPPHPQGCCGRRRGPEAGSGECTRCGAGLGCLSGDRSRRQRGPQSAPINLSSSP